MIYFCPTFVDPLFIKTSTLIRLSSHPIIIITIKIHIKNVILFKINIKSNHFCSEDNIITHYFSTKNYRNLIICLILIRKWRTTGTSTCAQTPTPLCVHFSLLFIWPPIVPNCRRLLRTAPLWQSFSPFIRLIGRNWKPEIQIDFKRKPPRPHRRRPMVTDFFETFFMRRGPQKNIRFLLWFWPMTSQKNIKNYFVEKLWKIVEWKPFEIFKWTFH